MGWKGDSLGWNSLTGTAFTPLTGIFGRMWLLPAGEAKVTTTDVEHDDMEATDTVQGVDPAIQFSERALL